MYVYTHLYMYIYIYIYVYIYICIYVCTYIQVGSDAPTKAIASTRLKVWDSMTGWDNIPQFSPCPMYIMYIYNIYTYIYICVYVYFYIYIIQIYIYVYYICILKVWDSMAGK
jgi:hypothetical protein